MIARAENRAENIQQRCLAIRSEAVSRWLAKALRAGASRSAPRIARQHGDVSNNASPPEGFVRPPGRNPANIVPLPPAKLRPHNDLLPKGEAKSTE
jgi:hypothetical protein